MKNKINKLNNNIKIQNIKISTDSSIENSPIENQENHFKKLNLQQIK